MKTEMKIQDIQTWGCKRTAQESGGQLGRVKVVGHADGLEGKTPQAANDELRKNEE